MSIYKWNSRELLSISSCLRSMINQRVDLTKIAIILRIRIDMKYELHLLLAANKMNRNESNESDRLHCIAIGLPINYRTTFSKGRPCRFSPSRRYTTTTKLLLIDNLPLLYLLFMPPKFKHNLTSVHPFVSIRSQVN